MHLHRYYRGIYIRVIILLHFVMPASYFVMLAYFFVVVQETVPYSIGAGLRLHFDSLVNP